MLRYGNKLICVLSISEGFDFNHLLELEYDVKELTLKVRDLEGQLAEMRQERDRLEREANEVQEGREEENRIIQEVNLSI